MSSLTLLAALSFSLLFLFLLIFSFPFNLSEMVQLIFFWDNLWFCHRDRSPYTYIDTVAGFICCGIEFVTLIVSMDYDHRSTFILVLFIFFFLSQMIQHCEGSKKNKNPPYQWNGNDEINSGAQNKKFQLVRVKKCTFGELRIVRNN